MVLYKHKDISIELYLYLYNNVSLFRFYKYLSLEQFIIRGNIAIVTRYVDYLKFSKLFLLDTNGKGKLVCALGRKSLCLYVYINPGLRKIRGIRVRLFVLNKFYLLWLAKGGRDIIKMCEIF